MTPRPAGRGGGRWAPITPGIEAPWRWSLRIGRTAGIELRLHALLAAWLGLVGVRIAAGPVWSDVTPRSAGLVAMGGMAVVVAGLLGELGRQVVAARLGVRPLVLTLWPLGALEDLPPHARTPDRLRVVTGGLGLLVAAAVALGVPLALMTGTVLGVAVPSPTGDVPPGVLQLGDGSQPWWLPVLHELQRGVVTVLALHLVPMPPLAAGRFVELMARDRHGPGAGRRLALQVGVVASTLLLLGAVATQAWLGVLVAVVGGLAATGELSERGRGGAGMSGEMDDLLDAEPAPIRLAPPDLAARRVADAAGPERGEEEDADEDDDDGDGGRSAAVMPDLDWLDLDEAPEEAGVEARSPGAATGDPSPPSRAEAPGRVRPSGDPAEALDRVLAKIAREGMDGLDDSDRAVLEAETRRRRTDD